MRRAIHYGIQPALLLGVLTLCAAWPTSEIMLPVGIVSVLIILVSLESLWPTRPRWRIGARERCIQIAVFIVLGAAAAGITEFYRHFLSAPLSELRAAWHLDVWPHGLPAAAQVLLVFFTSEFIWYWIHRAEHRWSVVWRVSGHGAHHSFKKLGALNSGLNHPFELVLLVLPTAMIELVFGVGSAAAGAVLLLATQASIAHSNLDLNTAGIGWLFTTNRHHIHHHSVVFDESNTNYGCGAIVWDRLFGTFADAATAEAGTGPTEPDLLGKFLMPFAEPSDTAIAPVLGSRNRA